MGEPTSLEISLRDGDVEIDAGYLAPKLGLSPRQLIDEMRRGIVYGVVETGVAEDEGRTRLTFRYRARAWRVVVEPDGTLVEASDPDTTSP
ncbi:MAG: DUF6522 family protein [Kiloniellales bacterium]|jgi:hypothetical protein|nr:DUF6522 family protein [Kiloniellales bacterium]